MTIIYTMFRNIFAPLRSLQIKRTNSSASAASVTFTGEIAKIGDAFIKNIQYQPCITCKYFSLYVPSEDYKYHDRNTNHHLSKCKKFGYMDIISGEIKYEAVGKARFDKDMCKLDGIYHIKNDE